MRVTDYLTVSAFDVQYLCLICRQIPNRLLDFLPVRQAEILKLGCVWHGRHVGRSQSRYRSVEVVERLVRDSRGNLCAKADVAVVFVDDKNLPGFHGGLDHTVLIEWRQGAEVENLRLDAFIGKSEKVPIFLL